MSISKFISKQLPERQRLLTQIHEIIIQKDKTVAATVEPMMRQEMIVYKDEGFFKYGLASVQKYMSLHLLPMYASADLYSKYKTLLPKAKFQKGCINFNNEEEMPLEIIKKLITDSSKIDLLALKERYLKSKKR
jgi:uncharacterized protein YdhG (YjbR/CyaY superfamily)